MLSLMFYHFAFFRVLLLIFPVMFPQAMPRAEIAAGSIAMMAFVYPIGFDQDVDQLPAVVALLCGAECVVRSEVFHLFPSR